MQAARRRAALIFRAGSAGGPKPGRVGFYLGVVRRRAASSPSAINAPATPALQTQNISDLGFPGAWQNLCAEADIYCARLMEEMNSE